MVSLIPDVYLRPLVFWLRHHQSSQKTYQDGTTLYLEPKCHHVGIEGAAGAFWSLEQLLKVLGLEMAAVSLRMAFSLNREKGRCG